jgi:xylan 1,4-beta-xylosidase
VLNVFRMFAKMSSQRLAVESDAAVPLEEILRRGVREKPDVTALASLDQNKLCVLIWHYHDDDVPGPEAEIELALNALPIASGEATLQHFRIDEDHSNAFTAWKRLGSPQQPTPEQYSQLEQTRRLAALAGAENVRAEKAGVVVRFKLPRQAVSLLTLTW